MVNKIALSKLLVIIFLFVILVAIPAGAQQPIRPLDETCDR
jgi:hypothetical protein